MSELDPQKKQAEWQEWQFKLAQANDNNILCHCRRCHAEWVDSDDQASCHNCGSVDVEHIACWQFPDD